MKKNKNFLRNVSLPEVVRVISPTTYITSRGKTRCPLHDDKHPSFVHRTVDGVDRWKCYAGCGSGTVIDFIVKSGACKTHADAFKWLLEKELLDASLFSSDDSQKHALAKYEKYTLSQLLYSRLNILCKKRLLESDDDAQKVRDYFFSRGIQDIETILSKYDVGFFDPEALDKEFKKTELRSLALLEKGKSSFKYGKSIVFFYRRAFDEYSGYKLRALGKDFKPLADKKFTWVCNYIDKGLDIGFFGLNCLEGSNLEAVQNSDLVLVEGEFDVLVPQYKALSFYGDVLSLICRSGGSAATPQAFENLYQQGIKSIAIFPDCDDAGREFIRGCSNSAAMHNISVEVVWPAVYETKKGTDPAELAQSLNANEIRNLISGNRKPISSYLADESYRDMLELSKSFSDAVALRLRSINVFVDKANDFSLTDSIRMEYAQCLANLIQDPLMSYERILSELTRKSGRYKTIRVKDRQYIAGDVGYEILINASGDSEKSFYQRVTNFIVRYDKIIRFKQKEGFEVEGSILVNGKKKGGDFIINSKELSTPEHFNNLIRERHPIGIEGLSSIKPILPDIVSMSNSEVSIYEGIDRVGYVPGTRTFVTPSTVIQNGSFSKNNEYSVPKSDITVNRFFNAVDFPEADMDKNPPERCVEVLIGDYLNCTNRGNALLTLGHIYSSVLTPYFRIKMPPHALFFRGLAGSYKSTFAQVSMGLFYKKPFDIKWLHARDTPNSIEMILSYVNNAPMVLDDIKIERANAEEVLMIIQSLYDEQGRSRLKKDMTVREGREVSNQALIVTGEVVPTSQLSVLSRMVQLEFIRDESDIDRFDNIKGNLGALRGLTPLFIRWLQDKYKGEYVTLTNVPCAEKFRQERTYFQLTKMLTGLKEFLTFLEESSLITVLDSDRLIKESLEFSKDVLLKNVRTMKSLSKDTCLLEDISTLIRLKLFSLNGPQMNSTEIGRINDKGEVVLDIPQLTHGLKVNGKKLDRSTVSQIFLDLETKNKCRVKGRHAYVSKSTLLKETKPKESTTNASTSVTEPQSP